MSKGKGDITHYCHGQNRHDLGKLIEFAMNQNWSRIMRSKKKKETSWIIHRRRQQSKPAGADKHPLMAGEKNHQSILGPEQFSACTLGKPQHGSLRWLNLFTIYFQLQHYLLSVFFWWTGSISEQQEQNVGNKMLSKEVGADDSLWSLPTRPILWFCGFCQPHLFPRLSG